MVVKILRLMVVFCFVATAVAQTPNADTVRDTYQFTWAYGIKIELNGKKVELAYHIEPGADYFGYSMKLLPGVFEVTDVGRDLTFKTFNKTAKLSARKEKPQKTPKIDKHQYTRLPDKTILGYRCIGVKATSDTEEATIYFTNEAEASYAELYKKLAVHRFVLAMTPYGFTDKSLLMSSEVIRTKTGEHASITCTGFEKQLVFIRKSDYQWTN